MFHSNLNVWAFNVSSDRQLKTDITSFDSAIRDLDKLGTYRFRYKADPEQKVNLGLMEQEIEKVYVSRDRIPSTPQKIFTSLNASSPEIRVHR
jgi:hypothetical protein